MHYVDGPNYIEEPVAPKVLDKVGQEKTGQEGPASSLKDTDEQLEHKEKETEDDPEKKLAHTKGEGEELNVSKDQTDDLNQKEAREELITAKIVDQTSDLKDTDEKLAHKKEELNRETK